MWGVYCDGLTDGRTERRGPSFLFSSPSLPPLLSLFGMGRSKNNRRKNARRRQAGENNPSGLPSTDDLAALGSTSTPKEDAVVHAQLLKNLTHQKATEREAACLYAVRTFEACSTDVALKKLRQFQVTNVLGTLIDRLADGVAAVRLLAAGAFRNIASFEDEQVHEILLQVGLVKVMDNSIQQIPHALPVMAAARAAGGNAAEAAKQTIDNLFHAELLNTTLNMCQYSQQVVEHVTRSTKIPNVLFQILVHPAGAAGRDATFFPHVDLAVCRIAASLLHTLTEENQELNEQMRAGQGGALAKAIVEIVDRICSAAGGKSLEGSYGGTLAQPDDAIKAHWHLMGVLGNLCSTSDDFFNLLEKAMFMFQRGIGDILLSPSGAATTLGQKTSEMLETAGSEVKRAYQAVKDEGRKVTDQDETKVRGQYYGFISSFVDRVETLNLGMEVLSTLFTMSVAHCATENSLRQKIGAFEGATVQLGTIACTNPFASWNPAAVEDGDACTSLITANINFSVRAANMFNSWVQHFSPSSTSRENSPAFAGAWLNFSTAVLTAVMWKSKNFPSSAKGAPQDAQKLEQKIHLQTVQRNNGAIRDGLDDLAVALMSAAERVCAQYTQEGTPPQLDNVSRLDLLHRVLMSPVAPAEARSSALRVMLHQAVSHKAMPGLYKKAGGVLNELLTNGSSGDGGTQPLPLLVLADALDVTYDLFGDEAEDGVYVQSGLAHTLPAVLAQGHFQSRYMQQRSSLDQGSQGHIEDTITNLQGFVEYKHGTLGLQ